MPKNKITTILSEIVKFFNEKTATHIIKRI